ncbi:hypothetical protein ACQUFY_12040 [Robbsia andropogonis]|uniref:hypothetical protein n=1 Tax=Robbsia andropogonis TaxID=28092 RepID=UPI003D243517
MRPPRNGDVLLAARRRGEKPSGAVIVSLVGQLPDRNFTLYVDATSPERFDWKSILGLDIEIVTNLRYPFSNLLGMLADMTEAVPASMLLRYTEGPQIALGKAHWLPEAMDGKFYRLFDWWPFALTPGRAALKVEKALWRHVGTALPDYYLPTMGLCIERMEQGKAAWQA